MGFYIFVISSFLIAISALGLGIFVLAKNAKRDLNRAFFLLNLSIAVWSFGLAMKTISQVEAEAVLWTRIFYLGAILIPVFYLYFVTVFVNTNGLSKRILNTYYVLCVIFLGLDFTKLFLKGVVHKPFFIYWTDPGPLFSVFVLYFFTCVGYAHYLLIRSWRKSSGFKKNQTIYFLVASLIAFLGSTTDYLSIFNIAVYPFGHPFILAYPPILAYSISEHQLMDINIVIRKGTVYTYLSLLILIPCMAAIVIAQRFLCGRIYFAYSFVTFFILLFAGLLFLRIKPGIEEKVEMVLFKKRYEYKKVFNELSKSIISYLDEKELFTRTFDILISTLGNEKVSFFLLDHEKRVYRMRASHNMENSGVQDIAPDNLLLQFLREERRPVVREALAESTSGLQIKYIVELLDAMESEVCIPLITRDELIGIINVGKKREGEMYSHEDLELFANFAAQAAVALENARLFQQMQKTQTMMRRSDRLTALGFLTAGLAHEIRNPLVTIKTFIDLLPERYESEEFRSDFSRLAASEVARINALVSELLNFAHPSKPKFKKMDVEMVLKDIVSLVSAEAKKRDITLMVNLQKRVKAKIDEHQIKQVFLNIVLNAIEAVSAHGKISIKTRSIKKNSTEYIQVEISDNGKGIPKKILEHIFDPFFTTKKGGTGLGLSISHQIVQEHNGTIDVESKLKGGTTFFINLPSS
jgi:two-component system NtrC family sensor kinase